MRNICAGMTGRIAMWILPFHMGMDTGLQYCNIPVTEWEVDY